MNKPSETVTVHRIVTPTKKCQGAIFKINPEGRETLQQAGLNRQTITYLTDGTERHSCQFDGVVCRMHEQEYYIFLYRIEHRITSLAAPKWKPAPCPFRT